MIWLQMHLRGSLLFVTTSLNMEVTLTGDRIIFSSFFHVASYLKTISLISSCLLLCRIYLMGQSAGAHISACALLEQAIREAKGEEGISWSVSQIKAYFGLSGG